MLNTFAVTYEISRTLSVLFSRDVHVKLYLTSLRTKVAKHPYKL